MLIRAIIYSLCTIWFASLSYPSIAANQAPQSVIEEAFAIVKSSIDEGRLHENMSEPELLAFIDTTFGERIDFDRFARGVMGKFARRATVEQQRAFSDLLKALMLKTYSKGLEHLDRFDRTDITQATVNPSNDRSAVATKLYLKGGEVYEVTYQMRRSEHGWRVTNIVAEGINLGLVFRNQFADSFSTQGSDMDATLRYWADLVGENSKTAAAVF